MGQDAASGRAGREYGLQMGERLAALLGAKKVRNGSNEVLFGERRAVIKAAAPNNDSIGVTALMLKRLDEIYGGFEDEQGGVEVWRLSPEDFRGGMRPSPSARNRGADTRLVRKLHIREVGERVAYFTADQLRG
ncbi:MAG TPA: hypothetical protein VN018_05055 [Brevundimonas sp.]|nr:hypothetical protein [Brevundimonas sp.]